jgi:hypothetical protein
MGKGLVIGAVIFIVLGLVVMTLWNALLPAILGEGHHSGRRWAFWC